MGEEEEGAGSVSPLPAPSGRSRPCARLPSPLASEAAPPPAWLAPVGGTP